jgi:hypothetical protein
MHLAPDHGQAATICELPWMVAQELAVCRAMRRVRIGRPVFLRSNRFQSAEFRSFPGRNSNFVSIDYDYQTQALTAMRRAMAATCERERLEWVRIALAWHDLAPTCATLPGTEAAPRGLRGVGSRLRRLLFCPSSGYHWHDQAVASAHLPQKILQSLC